MIRACRLLLIATPLVVFALSVAAPVAAAQETSSDWAWKSIVKHRGVEFQYIFYTEADTENNGVVLKLINSNDYPVRYRFLVIFRSSGEAIEQLVTGRVGAKKFITGDEEGLFFIPFKDGREIAEIGLKSYRVYKLPG